MSGQIGYITLGQDWVDLEQALITASADFTEWGISTYQLEGSGDSTTYLIVSETEPTTELSEGNKLDTEGVIKYLWKAPLTGEKLWARAWTTSKVNVSAIGE